MMCTPVDLTHNFLYHIKKNKKGSSQSSIFKIQFKKRSIDLIPAVMSKRMVTNIFKN